MSAEEIRLPNNQVHIRTVNNSKEPRKPTPIEMDTNKCVKIYCNILTCMILFGLPDPEKHSAILMDVVKCFKVYIKTMPLNGQIERVKRAKPMINYLMVDENITFNSLHGIITQNEILNNYFTTPINIDSLLTDGIGIKHFIANNTLYNIETYNVLVTAVKIYINEQLKLINNNFLFKELELISCNISTNIVLCNHLHKLYTEHSSRIYDEIMKPRETLSKTANVNEAPIDKTNWLTSNANKLKILGTTAATLGLTALATKYYSSKRGGGYKRRKSKRKRTHRRITLRNK